MRRTSAAARILVLTLALAGCGPDLVWYGHGTDRTRRFEIYQRGSEQWLVEGERVSARFDAIATQGFARSPHGSRVAFAALRKDATGRERWQVLLDLRPGPSWDAVAALRFDPRGTRLAYLAELGGRWRAVVDDRPGPGFDSIDPDTLAFSPDGTRVGYVAFDGACQRVVIDDHVGRCVHAVRAFALAARAENDLVIESDAQRSEHSRVLVGGVQVLAVEQPVGRLVTDASRAHWALELVGFGEQRARLVGRRAENAQPAPLAEADQLGHIVLAPDGSRLAYTLRQGDRWFAVLDDGASSAGSPLRSTAYDAIEAPVFSADARHVGYLARGTAHADVVIDGHVRERVPTPTATALALSPDGTRLSYVYRDAHGPVLVVDRAAHRFDVIVEGTLRFDPRGEHWAALAGERSRRELFVVVDGEVRLPFDATELFGGGLGEEGDVIELLGRWVEAELARFLDRGGRSGSRVPVIGAREASGGTG